MKFEFKVKESKKNLLTSIIFLIIGSLIFAYPNAVVSTAAKIIGVLLLLYGIFMAIKNYYDTKQNSDNPSTTLIFAIISIVFGVLFIVLSDSIAQIVQYVIGAWILFNGIQRLIIAISIGKDNNSFITQLVIAILLLSAGLYTILKANLPLQIVGLIIIIYSILEIIGFIFNKENFSNDKVIKETNKIIETKEEVKETNTEDNKNVKEAKIIEEKKKTKKKDKK